MSTHMTYGRSLDEMKCSDCGEFLINAESHATCPNMHGKLRRKLSEVELAVIQVRGLPVVKSGPKRGQHSIDGRKVKAVKRFHAKRAARALRDNEGLVAECEAFVAGYGLFEYVETSSVNQSHDTPARGANE